MSASRPVHASGDINEKHVYSSEDGVSRRIDDKEKTEAHASVNGMGRRSKNYTARRVLAVLGILAILALAGLAVFEGSRVFREIEAESGTVLTADDFLRIKDNDAYFTTKSDEIVTGDAFKVSTPGTYNIYIRTGLMAHKCVLTVSDTVSPEIETQSVTLYTNLQDKEVSADRFIAEAADETTVSYDFVSRPDFESEGEQDVQIVATDEGGNSVVRHADLIVVVDTEPPKVNAENFTGFVGDPIMYRLHVGVSDDQDPEPELEIDNWQVDAENEGTYPVTYTATDRAGNTTSVTVNLTLKKHAYSLETVFALCDEVLSEITTPEMSKREICYAIYNWAHNHIYYTTTSEKGDWLKSAYQGLTERYGDCYIYFSTAKALLTRAGIKNMDIEKIPDGDNIHFWSIVDIEDGHGWYHFDTTPHLELPNLCLITTEELMAYSNSRYRPTHDFDPSKYPEIP